MSSQNLNNNIIKLAEKICIKDNVKLTTNRRNVLALLLNKKKALSAYEISNKLNEIHKVSIPTMSVYRTLDFLVERKIVHKISSINKYTICTHLMCDHSHSTIKFAVCTSCLKVIELISKTFLNSRLKSDLDAINFNLKKEQVELFGLCSSCNNIN